MKDRVKHEGRKKIAKSLRFARRFHIKSVREENTVVKAHISASFSAQDVRRLTSPFDARSTRFLQKKKGEIIDGDNAGLDMYRGEIHGRLVAHLNRGSRGACLFPFSHSSARPHEATLPFLLKLNHTRDLTTYQEF